MSLCPLARPVWPQRLLLHSRQFVCLFMLFIFSRSASAPGSEDQMSCWGSVLPLISSLMESLWGARRRCLTVIATTRLDIYLHCYAAVIQPFLHIISVSFRCPRTETFNKHLTLTHSFASTLHTGALTWSLFDSFKLKKITFSDIQVSEKHYFLFYLNSRSKTSSRMRWPDSGHIVLECFFWVLMVRQWEHSEHSFLQMSSFSSSSEWWKLKFAGVVFLWLNVM